MMLPSNSFKLNLSKLSIVWNGTNNANDYEEKGIPSLESLRAQALENGVEFIACQMSMDVMGVKKRDR